MSILISVAVGAAIGVVLGSLGAGGSILTVPALVYLLGQDAQTATTVSLVVVGVGSIGGVVPHWRDGHVRVRSGLGFGAAGVVGSLAGARLNRMVDGDVLLLTFGILLLIVAVFMWRRDDDTDDADRSTVQGRARVLRIAAAGTGVGFLTGFFGVGGGFVIVPALVFALGFAMPVAIGTSLVAIVVNVIAALVGRAGALDLPLGVTVAFTAAVTATSWLSGRLAGRFDSERLTQAFIGVISLIGLAMLVQSSVSLLTGSG